MGQNGFDLSVLSAPLRSKKSTRTHRRDAEDAEDAQRISNQDTTLFPGAARFQKGSDIRLLVFKRHIQHGLALFVLDGQIGAGIQ
jgi:predicted acyl esterase